MLFAIKKSQFKEKIENTFDFFLTKKDFEILLNVFVVISKIFEIN